MPAFHSSAVGNWNVGPLQKHCPSLLALDCPSEVFRSWVREQHMWDLSPLVSWCSHGMKSKLQAGGTACRVSQCQPAGISGPWAAGQKGEIHLHLATLLSPTAAAVRDVAMSTIPTWRWKTNLNYFQHYVDWKVPILFVHRQQNETGVGWWGGKTQISLLICNTPISMCLKMFIGWSVRLEQVHTTINYCISSQQAHGFREENTVSVYSFCNFLWSPVGFQYSQ